ncbi:MAG TPA: DUF4332 domain-containing protein [Candidatus Thermoplasmatota archaeon]|nr:DUF4332 domain-containing protein [Candidatus Thermoplasmatota archaeon]
MDSTSTAAKQVRFYRTLAFIVVFGLVAAWLFPLAGIPGLGKFRPDEAAVGLSVAVIMLSVVTILFLLRIGRIFDVEGQMERRLGDEARVLQETQKRQEDAWAEFRNDLKQELAETRAEFRRSQEEQDAKYLGIGADAAGARRFAEELAATRTLVQKNKDEIAPLLVDLRTRMEAQEQKARVLENRLADALDALERREMEAAAARTQAEQELAALRKREQLLVIRTKELEDHNEVLVREKGRLVSLTKEEAAQHVSLIPNLGPVNVSRLNTMGVITIPQLRAARVENVAAALDVDPDTVRKWQSIGDLLRLEGVPQPATEYLVEAGVRSVPALAAMDSGELSRKLQDVERARRTKSGLDFSQASVAAWITAARDGKMVQVAA